MTSPALAQMADRLLAFQHFYEQIAKPFEWKFTRADLHELMQKYLARRPSPWPLKGQNTSLYLRPRVLRLAARPPAHLTC
jgi:hypothetical protein